VTGACAGAGVARVPIARVAGARATAAQDELSVEAPLDIRVAVHGGDAAPRSLAVTMRTPGDDVELATGFLVSEGVIAAAGDLVAVAQVGANAVQAVLHPGVRFDPGWFDRHSFVSSACGACGKRLIEAVRVNGVHRVAAGTPRIDPDVVHALPARLRAAQSAFLRTGGIHASGLFDVSGRLLLLREDVGRHNALDKLIGAELRAGGIPARDRLLLVSGRVGFELVQKAAMAGIPALAAVGAPSSMAVDLARAADITLLGFLRDGRFNVYTDAGRLG